MPRGCSAVAFACMLVGHAGCASQLDFDAVSAGKRAGQSASSPSDAGHLWRLDASGRYHESDSSPSVTARAARAAGGQAPAIAASADAGAPKQAAHAAGSGGGHAAMDAGASLAGADSDAGTAPTLPTNTSFCGSVTPAPALCDDFEGDPALGMWSAAVVDPLSPTPAGTVAVDTRAARSGAASLLAVVDPAVPSCEGCDISVALRSLFYELQGHQELTIEFDMRVEQIDWHIGRRSALLHFYMGSPERGYSQHTLQLRSAGEQVEAAFVELDTDGQVAGSTPETLAVNHGWQPGPLLHEWVHVKYVLDAVDSNGSGNALRVTVGDAVLMEGTLYYGLRYREPGLELGLPYVYTSELGAAESNEGWQVRFDNVVVVIQSRS